jgi:hypothetical protein
LKTTNNRKGAMMRGAAALPPKVGLRNNPVMLPASTSSISAHVVRRSNTSITKSL